MAKSESKSWAVMGVLSRADGGLVTTADNEALWEAMTVFASRRGLRFSGRLVPIDLDRLTPEKVEEALRTHPNDPL